MPSSYDNRRGSSSGGYSSGGGRGYGDGGRGGYRRSDNGGGYGGGRPKNDFYESNGKENQGQQGPKPFERNFFTPSSDYEYRSRADIEAYRTKHEMTLKRGEAASVPGPIFDFADAGFERWVMEFLQAEKFSTPTPIQAQGWPIALSGHDLVAIAQTGSGKTLGFLLPGFVHMMNQATAGGRPKMLVMAPTRELCQQIHEVAVKLSRFTKIRPVAIFGGAPKFPQISAIERGCDLIIATPGRLNDLIEMRKICLSDVTFLVLDEADRMLDMGFEPQIRKIMRLIRSNRQLMLWSATWPKEVRKMAEDFLGSSSSYVHISIGSQDAMSANQNILQIIDVCQDNEKTEKLGKLLYEIVGDGEVKDRIIIFANTKRSVDEMTRTMRGEGYPAMCLHGDKGQHERESVMRQFRSGHVPILVATDVAARGLDVDDVKFVINYDYPTNSEEYVHRIGRTGRKGATGTAYTFFTVFKNGFKAKELVKVLEATNQVVNPKLYDIAAKSGGRGGGGGMYRTSGFNNRKW